MKTDLQLYYSFGSFLCTCNRGYRAVTAFPSQEVNKCCHENKDMFILATCVCFFKHNIYMYTYTYLYGWSLQAYRKLACYYSYKHDTTAHQHGVCSYCFAQVCQEIDECAESTHNCHPLATCRNSVCIWQALSIILIRPCCTCPRFIQTRIGITSSLEVLQECSEFFVFMHDSAWVLHVLLQPGFQDSWICGRHADLHVQKWYVFYPMFICFLVFPDAVCNMQRKSVLQVKISPLQQVIKDSTLVIKKIISLSRNKEDSTPLRPLSMSMPF